MLQMQGDYQLRRAGHYPDLDKMAEEVLSSFAHHAADGRHLVFKMHPLENALHDWPGIIRRIAARHGVAGRVHVIDGGNLGQLYQQASGAVLINSTAGLAALQQGLPVKVLGIAIYDIARLTHQGPLDTFWEAPEAPVPETLAAFRKLLIASVQVKGNFFTREGRARAVPEFARRLIARDVNGHGAFLDPPPRLARARAMGVPMIYEDPPCDPVP
jgi:capsular polysaccharide export protein